MSQPFNYDQLRPGYVPPTDPPKQKKSRNKIILGIIGLFLLLLVSCSVGSAMGGSSTSVSAPQPTVTVTQTSEISEGTSQACKNALRNADKLTLALREGYGIASKMVTETDESKIYDLIDQLTELKDKKVDPYQAAYDADKQECLTK